MTIFFALGDGKLSYLGFLCAGKSSAKKQGREKTLLEKLEGELPQDVRVLKITALPLQFVGRTYGSLTEHELVGIGRSMAINTRKMLLQVSQRVSLCCSVSASILKMVSKIPDSTAWRSQQFLVCL